MANPLEVGMVSPPAPNQNDNGNALQQGAPAQQQNAPPPPTHAQTVAALRHFDAIKGELKTLLANPALGKSDIHSAIIDGVTNLVGKRIMAPAEAVMELSKVSDQPLEQRKMLQQQLMQTIQAERAIIAHHGSGFAGGGPEPTPSADDHIETMRGLHANYSQK